MFIYVLYYANYTASHSLRSDSHHISTAQKQNQQGKYLQEALYAEKRKNHQLLCWMSSPLITLFLFIFNPQINNSILNSVQQYKVSLLCIQNTKEGRDKVPIQNRRNIYCDKLLNIKINISHKIKEIGIHIIKLADQNICRTEASGVEAQNHERQ